MTSFLKVNKILQLLRDSLLIKKKKISLGLAEYDDWQTQYGK